jgi:hypothetical protein
MFTRNKGYMYVKIHVIFDVQSILCSVILRWAFFDTLSFDVQLFNVRSFDVHSFDVESFDVRSFDFFALVNPGSVAFETSYSK